MPSGTASERNQRVAIMCRGYGCWATSTNGRTYCTCAADTAIPVGVLRQILLVVLLGEGEVSEWRDLGRDLSVAKYV
jgi:hypothetical protein